MESRNSLLIGQIALDLRLLTRQQLQECLNLQAGQVQPRPIGSLLLETGVLTEVQLANVMDEQRRRLKESAPYASAQKEEITFGRLLVKGNHATQERVNEALRAQQDLAERGIRKRLGEMLVEAGHLSPEIIPSILKQQGKVLMACTFCGSHLNVLQCIADGFPCRKCGMPLGEQTVSIGAEDTAYLLPAIDPRIITKRALVPVIPEPASTPAPAPTASLWSSVSRARLAVLIVILLIFAVAVFLLSRKP